MQGFLSKQRSDHLNTRMSEFQDFLTEYHQDYLLEENLSHPKLSWLRNIWNVLRGKGNVERAEEDMISLGNSPTFAKWAEDAAEEAGPAAQSFLNYLRSLVLSGTMTFGGIPDANLQQPPEQGRQSSVATAPAEPIRPHRQPREQPDALEPWINAYAGWASPGTSTTSSGPTGGGGDPPEIPDRLGRAGVGSWADAQHNQALQNFMYGQHKGVYLPQQPHQSFRNFLKHRGKL